MNEMTNDPSGMTRPALDAVRSYLATVRAACLLAVAPAGKPDLALLQAEQRRLHGFAWAATTVEAMEQLARWGMGKAAGERLVVQIGLGEYLAQLIGGLPMGQNEIVRPVDLGTEDAADTLAHDPAVCAVLRGNTPAARAELARLLADGWRPDESLGDETLDMVRGQFRQFTDDRVAPFAQEWHLSDTLIPDALIAEMAELGVFGVCIDPEFGGLGLGKLAMCVVSEELSRGWIAAGSLGTRSEIAGELIGQNGTAAQKARWLPGIAAGDILPTAVFTEPDTGSDLASVRTRAKAMEDGTWRITGSKTWITHAARSDVMTVLARSEPDVAGFAGLSMFLAAKTRGDDAAPFRDAGVAGSEIPVLGYRGMKEYVLSFDDFAVDADGLLGGERGAGFRQLMRTFEGARIQTAARAVGVARNALDLGLAYALGRRQFGSNLMAFPRVSDKIAMMAVETVMAQQITYYAARTKDAGERCDIEAGMAKLLAARVAWSNADASLQIHGGNGYALEYPISRVLCDARILNIFEGAAEIQATVVGRGLLGRQG
ncbi:MAG: acyl-CoA dehydrogenase family protein [Janthinobacterium lividum]